MSVVRINAITVPKERADELEARFAARAREVSSSPGFEAFELLRPADERDVYLVYTRWRSEEDFQAWVSSPAFEHGHRAARNAGSREQPQRPVVIRRRAARGRTDDLAFPRACALRLPQGLGLRRDQRERGGRCAGADRLAGSRPRGRWLWIVTIVAESMMILQVLVGAILEASKEYAAPRFHCSTASSPS